MTTDERDAKVLELEKEHQALDAQVQEILAKKAALHAELEPLRASQVKDRAGLVKIQTVRFN